MEIKFVISRLGVGTKDRKVVNTPTTTCVAVVTHYNNPVIVWGSGGVLFIDNYVDILTTNFWYGASTILTKYKHNYQ